jgi:excinuclease ABC subunit A
MSLFSFNSPYGACQTCSGLGEVSEADQSKIIPNPKLSIKKGGLAPLGEYKKTWIFDKLDNNENKWLNKDFWLRQSDNLFEKGKADELNDTARSRMPAFFESSNVNLPAYGQA